MIEPDHTITLLGTLRDFVGRSCRDWAFEQRIRARAKRP